MCTRRVFQEVMRNFFFLLYFRNKKDNVTFNYVFLEVFTTARVLGPINSLRIGKVCYIVAFSTTAIIICSIIRTYKIFVGRVYVFGNKVVKTLK